MRDSVFINDHDPRLFEGFSMGNPKIQTGNLLEKLNESPTSILVEAEEVNITRIKQMLTRFMLKILNIVVGVHLFLLLKS